MASFIQDALGSNFVGAARCRTVACGMRGLAKMSASR